MVAAYGILRAMQLEFTKMHGLGNDFIVFDAPRDGRLPTPEQWRALSARHTGIGFDQALILEPPRREGTQALRCDCRANFHDMREGALGVALCLVARCGQLGDAILERRVAYVDDAILNRAVKPLELSFRLGRAPCKVGDMLATLVHPLVAPFENLIHQSFETRRIE